MVCVTEFRHLVWFRVEILIVCLLAWSRPFAMAENSIMDSGVKGTSCSTKIVDKLEHRFGVEKQHELHQAHLHNRRPTRKRKCSSSCCRYQGYVQSSLSGFIT